MTALAKDIEVLLSNAKSIVAHQEEIKKLKGESFNVFSILKMEHYENETHSAFIGELLNPDGSHMCGPLFLQLFLKTVGYNGNFNSATAKLELEKYIGALDHELRIGGRVDIFISDAAGNTICIENKIYAGDQRTQIERYGNHNKEKNTVYYLTREGIEPSESSKGKLKERKDYFNLSYKYSIIQWLDKCLKESAEQPILRETIRQYIILLKKITDQLNDSKMEKEIINLIAANYATAKVISVNIWQIELDYAHQFLLDIVDVLKKELNDEWEITIDENLDVPRSGLKITHNNWNGIFLKLEAETRIPWNKTYYGIVAPDEVYDRTSLLNRLSNTSLLEGGYHKTKAWPCYKLIMSLESTEERSRLFDEGKRGLLLKEVASKLVNAAREYQELLSGIQKIGS